MEQRKFLVPYYIPEATLKALPEEELSFKTEDLRHGPPPQNIVNAYHKLVDDPPVVVIAVTCWSRGPNQIHFIQNVDGDLCFDYALVESEDKLEWRYTFRRRAGLYHTHVCRADVKGFRFGVMVVKITAIFDYTHP